MKVETDRISQLPAGQEAGPLQTTTALNAPLWKKTGCSAAFRNGDVLNLICSGLTWNR